LFKRFLQILVENFGTYFKKIKEKLKERWWIIFFIIWDWVTCPIHLLIHIPGFFIDHLDKIKTIIFYKRMSNKIKKIMRSIQKEIKDIKENDKTGQ